MSAWRARRQRGVLRAPNPPRQRSQDHGKNDPHRERGQSRKKPCLGVGGWAEECALQEVKAEGSSAPRSRGGWAHSVRPSPPTLLHFPPHPGPPPAPTPRPGPPSQKTSLHTSLSITKRPLQPQQPSLSASSHSTPPAAFLLPRLRLCQGRHTQLLYSFLTSQPSNLLIISVVCCEFPPIRQHPFWLLRF